MRRLFILSFLVIALVAAGKLPGSNDPNNLKPSASGPSKRSPYLNPMTSYLRKMVDQEDNLAGRSVLSARELVRGARFLFWRFSLTTVTSYTATSTSTSTTTCTLSTSSTCTGRRRRSFLEHPEDDNKDESPANIIPSTVLKVETTAAPELDSARESRAAYYNRWGPNRSPGNRYYSNYNTRPDYALHSSFDGPYRNNYPSMSQYFGKYGPEYDSFDDDSYEDDPEFLPDAALKLYTGPGRRRPQLPAQFLEPEEQTAAFRWLFNSRSLFSTFTLTVTTTTGTSTVFTRTTVTSTPTCSSAGVYAQCPTG